jgi:solute carrier family 39 (zinc transporter), member 9
MTSVPIFFCVERGIEALASSSQKFPTSTVALSLLVGFIFMLIVEQLIPHSHGSTTPFKESTTDARFDVALEDREQGAGPSSVSLRADDPPQDAMGPERQSAFALTLGLAVHGLADGFALGVSSLPVSGTGSSSNLSLVVFFALLVHRGIW